MSSEPEMRATPRRVRDGTDGGTRQYSVQPPASSLQPPASSFQPCENQPCRIDQSYVVFAWKDVKGGPATSLCTRTTASGKAADLIAQLGPAAAPKSL
jgi:hypothetical protein